MQRRTVLTLGIASLCVPVAAAQPPTLEQKCEDLLRTWKKRLAEAQMAAFVEPPFVIAGDGGPGRVGRYRDGTIVSAARALKATYFRKDPDTPILILLWESEPPYRRLALKWFGDDGVSPFGYFRRTDHTMLMNVGTGTGTLVHELTHALIEPDFPEIPDWCNEGLASLYEQCEITGKRITGLPNWRLPALQDAIRANTLRPLEALIKDGEFRKPELAGINYAHARYLMYYLQEKDLLKPFYTGFRDNIRNEFTGFQTLKKLVAPQPFAAFEKDWRSWVLTLRFT